MSRSFFQDHEHPWVRSLTFKDISPVDLLKLVGHSSGPSSKTRAWLFDLDSTLFCVGPRIQAIYAHFLREHRAPPLHWLLALPELGSQSHRYGIEESFFHIFQKKDERQASLWAKELWGDFRGYWEEHFFSNRYMHWDCPYPGAKKFLEMIHSQGFDIIYLTGRDRPRTLQGTMDALRQADFPRGLNTHLFMKPSLEMPDLVFKERLSRTLSHRFQIEVSVDNEAENLVMFAEHFPKAEIVFFHSILSQRIPQKDYKNILGNRNAWRWNGYE